MSEKDKKDLLESQKESSSERKAQIQQVKEEVKSGVETNTIKPKKTFSNAVDAKAVDSLIQKHGFKQEQVQQCTFLVKRKGQETS